MTIQAELSIRGRVGASLVSQFGNPRGWLGSLAGWIMARRPSNRARNAWTVELLDPEPHHRVLEVGCGPGLALAHLAARCVTGKVVGVDRSPVMLRQARRRNRRAIAADRLELKLGDVERALPELPARSFDRIAAVNVAMFFVDRRGALQQLAELLKPGGRLALTQQPRRSGATREDASRIGFGWAQQLGELGFVDVQLHELDLRPVPAVCVTAQWRG